MQLFYKSLVVLILLASALTGCKKTNQDEVINPEERGQFKLALSDYINVEQSTKAEAQKPWESALKSLKLYVIHPANQNAPAGTDPCVYYHTFTAKELEKKTSVFNIPNVVYGDKYDFYVIANSDAGPTAAASVTRATLEALTETGRLADYNGGYAAMADGSFFTSGKGFAMSGMTNGAIPSEDETKPADVTISLNRLVAKVEVECNITQTFKDKYTDGANGLGGTFTIEELKITNVADNASILPPASMTAASSLQALTQAASYTGDKCNGLFYFYQNGITGTTITSKPRLVIKAKYAFDGNEIVVNYDNNKMDLDGQSAGSGLFLRNARYTVKVNINGLTPSEVVATIEVSDWAVAINQNIEFGSTNP